MLCQGCDFKFAKLFKPRPHSGRRVSFAGETDDSDVDGGDGNQRNHGGNRQTRSPGRKPKAQANKELSALLDQALQTAHDEEMRKALQSQKQRLDSLPPAPGEETAVEAVKRADGAWRAASHTHEQLVTQVLRLRSQLQAAEGKEKVAAEALARAERAKKDATSALAKAEGVKPQGAGIGETNGDSSVPTIGIYMNSEVFDKFEEWDVEETDKANLRQLKTELEQWKTNFETKDAELKTFLERVAAAQKDVLDRMTKKRKVDGKGADEGQGQPAAAPEAAPVPPAPPPPAPGAAASSAAGGAAPADDAQLKREAELLSQTRFRAAEAAAAAKAAGKGVQAGAGVKPAKATPAAQAAAKPAGDSKE